VDPSVKVGICNCESEVLPLSVDVPVVLLFRGLSGSRSQSTVDEFQALAGAYGGRFVLGLIDLNTEPSLTKAFGVQELPSVFGVIREQFYELAIGPLNTHQIRAVVDQFLQEALRQGVRGSVQTNWRFRQLQQGQSGFVSEHSGATGQQVQGSTTTSYVGYGVTEWEFQEPPVDPGFDVGGFF